MVIIIFYYRVRELYILVIYEILGEISTCKFTKNNIQNYLVY